MRVKIFLFLTSIVLLVSTGWSAPAEQWPAWRGPDHTGRVEAEGLISEWSLEGKNLLWRVDFIGRSTPIVMDGKVCALGRVGDGIYKQEQVACYSVKDGSLVWERRFNVFLTTVPFPRAGWASLTGDATTGNIFYHGVGGWLVALSPDGDILWERSLTEELGRYSGYGGRTFTPLVDGDLVIMGFATSGWGDQQVPRHRIFAFDKEGGKIVWQTTVGGGPADLNTYSTPVAADIDGTRALIGGAGDGSIFAVKLHTGEPMWTFQLSRRGINASVVVEGNRVYAVHSEENVDNEALMGRAVAIDATGSGDITTTHELWRRDKVTAGFASPALADGRLYMIDNSGNLVVLSSADGKLLHHQSLGTVGKGSPVVADGKLIAPEVNGALHIMALDGDSVRSLSLVEIPHPDGRMAEIYGSPAVAYGRIFLATEEGLYCVGDPATPVEIAPTRMAAVEPETGSGAPAHLQVVPAEIATFSGQTVPLTVRLFDAKGRFLRNVEPEWTVSPGLGSVQQGGLQAVAEKPASGRVTARYGDLEAVARVRVFAPLPWAEDFENVGAGKYPGHWIGAFSKFGVKRLEDGNHVLEKPRISRGIQRSYVYTGDSKMSGYTVSADLYGVADKRRKPDVGLIASRYILSLEGNYQKLSIHSWASEKRMYQDVDFPWEAGVWYSMKMKVDFEDGKAIVRGKVWPRAESEPEQWTIEATDPLPNTEGSPGLYGQSYAAIYYDNLKVVEN